MKKLFLTLLLSLSLICSANAQEKAKSYPESGIVPFAGLDDTSSPTITTDYRAADIQNITLDITGHLQKRYGYSYEILLDTNDEIDNFEAVTGLWEFYKSDSATRTKIATCGSKLFSWANKTKTDISHGVTITEGQTYQWVWITALDYAIGTNGIDPPIKTAGTNATTSVLSFTGLSNPITKAKCVVWWKNYLIFGNTYEGSTTHSTRIRWSNVGTIETWSNNDYVDIATFGGQQIEGFGIIYDDLYIFFTDSIYKISLVGGDELIIVTKIAEGIGAIAKNSIKSISIGNTQGLVFLSRDKTINYLDGIKVTEISTPISEIMDNLSATYLPYAVGMDDRTNAHYYLVVTNETDTVSTTTNNLLLDFNYAIGEWSKHTQIDANAMCMANDSNSTPQVYFGNYKSFIYQLNNSALNDDVSGYSGTVSAVYGQDAMDTTTASGLIVLYDTNLSNYTVFLSHFEGINGSTSFIDESEKTITVNGNTQIDTDYYKFGSASGLFDGSGDYLSLADSADWVFGTGDFTIDFYARFVDVTTVTTQVFLSQNGIGGTTGFVCSWYPGAGLRFQSTMGTVYDVAWSPSINTWYHIALVRNGNTLTDYINGVSIGSKDVTALNVTDDTNTLKIGSGSVDSGAGSWQGTLYFNGWIDEMRISKGIARWTADFTPSTTAYTNVDLVSGFKGATIRILSGIGIDDERIIADTTVSGIIVTNSTIATGSSVYSIGDIDAYYVTKWIDTGNAARRKNFEELYIWAETENLETIAVSYATDENTTIIVDDVDLYGGNTFGGISIRGEDTWVGIQTNFCRIPLNVSGRFIKVKFAESDINKTMNLYGYSIIYEPLDFY